MKNPLYAKIKTNLQVDTKIKELTPRKMNNSESNKNLYSVKGGGPVNKSQMTSLDVSSISKSKSVNNYLNRHERENNLKGSVTNNSTIKSVRISLI
jgi:hypothetical protein